MRLISIDFESEVPVYRQIASELRRLVAVGQLCAGDALPSLRELGEQLGVNLNTVARAYRQLEEEGLVELRHGSAARVRAPGESALSAQGAEGAVAVREAIGRWASRGLSREDIERRLQGLLEEVLPRRRPRAAVRSGGKVS